MQSGSSVDRRQYSGHIDAARMRLEMTTEELWALSFGCGGNVQLRHLDGFLRGRRDINPDDYDSLANVLNETFSAAGQGRPVPSSHDLYMTEVTVE